MNKLLQTLVMSLLVLTNIAIAENGCPYCGSWSPYGDFSKEVELFTISPQEIALPSCKPLRIELSEYSNEAFGYVPPKDATIEPATAVYASKEKLDCKRDFGQPKKGPAIVRFVLRPRGIENGEVLSVEISALHGGESLLQFGAMRSNHNPCDEGTHFGFHICSSKP